MQVRRKLVAGAVLAVVMTTALAACGSDSSGSGGSGGGGDKLLGIVESSGSDITTVQSANAAKAAAEKAGWKVSIIDSQSSVDKAIAGIQALVSRKATAIMVTVYASPSLQAGINVAQRAGIPVVSMAGGLAPGVGAALVSNSGAEVAAQMIKDMGGGDSGSVLALTYHPGLPCLLRGKSFDKFMKDYPNVKITRHEIDVQSAQQDSASTANAWLATKPKGPKAIFACYDDPAVGAVSAIKQSGVKAGEVKVYGFNAQANAREEIKSGYMTASMYYDTAAAGVICFEYIQKIMKAGDSWKQKEEDIPHELVDANNLASFESDHPDA